MTSKEKIMTFQECVLECAANTELIKQFDRLQGSNLSRVLIPQKVNRAPIERMIDEATGYNPIMSNMDEQFHKEFQEFIFFVFEYIWLPLCYSQNPS